MARRTKDVVIAADGRDQGKVFRITELPPRVGEKWAGRALAAYARTAGPQVQHLTDSDLANMGMAGIAMIGLRILTTLDSADAEPLMDEMMACVAVVPDPEKTDQMTGLAIVRPLRDDDIEEIATLAFLRSEVIEVHTGFSVIELLSTWGEKARQLFSNNTEMSPPPSEPPSAAD